MRVKNSGKFLVILGFFVFCCFGFLAKDVEASNVSFGQRILPVRFVYLDNEGAIKNIWSNISAKDSLYVVKFFDEKTKKEVRADEGLFERYRTSVKDDQEGSIVSKAFKGENKYFTQVSIDFVKKEGVFEEIQTIV